MGNDQSHLEKHGYTEIKQAGKGGYGKATIVKSKKNGATVVIKEELSNKMAKKEVSILKAMNHPNIVHYIGSFEEKEKLYIVMEYCEYGDLSDKIEHQKEKKIQFMEVQITEWFVQICQALKHVHDKKVIHRDIKPQNIFLTKNGQIKLGDFGISKICQRPGGYANTCCGTPIYMCPEILKKQPYTNKSDIWSLGCVLYELCMLQFSLGKSSISKSYSSELQELVKHLLKKNPTERPSVKDVLQKPFIQQHIQRATTYEVIQNGEKEEMIGVPDSLVSLSDGILIIRSEEDAIAAFNYSVLILSTCPQNYFDNLQKTIKDLYALADEFENQHKNSTIGSLSGGVMGAAGGIMSIVGLALTPFTLGASLIVTGVGIGVAVAGGAVGATSNITGMVKQSNIRNILEVKCQEFNTKIDPMITTLTEIDSCSKYFKQFVDDELTSSTTGMAFSRAFKLGGVVPEVVRLAQVASIGRVAAQAAKAVRVASALTGVLSGLFLIMDVAFIVKDSREIHEINTMRENNNTNANPGNSGTRTSSADLLEEVEEETVPRSNTLKLIKEIRKIAGHYQTALDEVRIAKTMIESEQKKFSY